MTRTLHALFFSLLLATPALAQLGNANQPPAPSPDVRPGSNNVPREVEREHEEGEKAERADKAKKPKVGKDEANRVKSQIVKEEAKLRKRLAKIERLRELALAQGNQERLRALDHLETVAREKYAKKVAKHKAKLNRRDSERLDDKLAKGRNGKAKGKNDKRNEHAGGASNEDDDGTGERDGRGGVLGNREPDADRDSPNANKRKMKEKAGRGQGETPGLGQGRNPEQGKNKNKKGDGR